MRSAIRWLAPLAPLAAIALVGLVISHGHNLPNLIPEQLTKLIPEQPADDGRPIISHVEDPAQPAEGDLDRQFREPLLSASRHPFVTIIYNLDGGGSSGVLVAAQTMKEFVHRGFPKEAFNLKRPSALPPVISWRDRRRDPTLAQQIEILSRRMPHYKEKNNLHELIMGMRQGKTTVYLEVRDDKNKVLDCRVLQITATGPIEEDGSSPMTKALDKFLEGAMPPGYETAMLSSDRN